MWFLAVGTASKEDDAKKKTLPRERCKRFWQEVWIWHFYLLGCPTYVVGGLRVLPQFCLSIYLSIYLFTSKNRVRDTQWPWGRQFRHDSSSDGIIAGWIAQSQQKNSAATSPISETWTSDMTASVRMYIIARGIAADKVTAPDRQLTNSSSFIVFAVHGRLHPTAVALSEKIFLNQICKIFKSNKTQRLF